MCGFKRELVIPWRRMLVDFKRELEGTLEEKALAALKE